MSVRLSFAAVILLAVCLLVGSAAQAELAIETFTVNSGGAADPPDHPYFSSDGSTFINIMAADAAGTPLYYISTDPELPAEPDWKVYGELNLWRPVGAGKTTFYGWTKDGEDVAGPAQDWIVHNDEDTNPTTITVWGDTTAGYHSVNVFWETNTNAVGWLEYRLAGSGAPYQTSAPSPTDYAEIHEVELTGLMDQAEYDIIIRSNGATRLYPMTTTPAPGTDANVLWTGGGGIDDIRWARGANWQGGFPPNDWTPGIVTFDVSATSNPAPAEGDTRSVAGMLLKKHDAGTIDVVFDLNDDTLEVRNKLELDTFNSRDAIINATFRNGTLRIGTSEQNRANILLNTDWNGNLWEHHGR